VIQETQLIDHGSVWEGRRVHGRADLFSKAQCLTVLSSRAKFDWRLSFAVGEDCDSYEHLSRSAIKRRKPRDLLAAVYEVECLA